MTGPSHEPLDEQERELARILRALPGAEPPSALDQRILRAAADAAAASRRPVRRWLAFGGAGWGIGSAAAAVLALGVGWHLLDPARNLPMERSAPVAAPAQDDGPITVGLGDHAEPPQAPAPPAAAPVAPVGRELRQTRSPARPRAAPALPQASLASPPPPPPAPVVESSADAAAVASEAAAPSVSSANGLTAEEVARLPAPQRAREEAARKSAADSARAAEAFEAERADAAAMQSREALEPVEWLARIRSQRDAGNSDEASASLRRFHEYYPQYAIPADLLPLMRE